MDAENQYPHFTFPYFVGPWDASDQPKSRVSQRLRQPVDDIMVLSSLNTQPESLTGKGRDETWEQNRTKVQYRFDNLVMHLANIY